MDAEHINHTGDATLLRKVNQSAVLELIRQQGPITRADIARDLRLSLPTITRIVTGLIEQGLVFERRSASSRSGRRPALLEFNARSGLIIGVYVGQNMVGALADLSGQILARRVAPALADEAGVQALIGLINELRAEAAGLARPVRGVGVGVPSVTLSRDGVVAWAPWLGWRSLPLRQRLEEALGLAVFVENEVNLLALGERWRGAGRGKCNLVCISLGTGIGAGLILNGQLYRGAHDAAGEAGYLVPNERYLGRLYDTFGCLESLAGSGGIVQRTLVRLSTGEPSVLRVYGDGGQPAMTADAVFQAARTGDLLARSVVDETVDYLSVALANLACILDPELVILTGELSEYGDLLLDPIRERIQGLIPVVPEMVLSDLRMDAAVLGAVAIVLHETSGVLSVQPTRA